MTLTLSEIADVFHNYEDCGATAIKLSYNGETATVHIRCTDDCEPYWTYGMEKSISPIEYARLLELIINGRFVRHTGEPYTVICEPEEY